MTDLYEQTNAAVEERLRLAEAASQGPWTADGPWRVLDAHRDPAVLGVPWAGGPDRNEANLGHIAANDPAFTIRACRADLARLDRHGPLNIADGSVCEACPDGVPWPCVEARALAGIYGIQVP